MDNDSISLVRGDIIVFPEVTEILPRGYRGHYGSARTVFIKNNYRLSTPKTVYSLPSRRIITCPSRSIFVTFSPSINPSEGASV